MDSAKRSQERDDESENQRDQDAFSLPPGCTIYYMSSLIALLLDQRFFVLALFMISLTLLESVA